MTDYFEDHGLPLVQLKEQRRDLIVVLMGRSGPISKEQLAEIAAVQHAIAAMEAVIVDLDAETCSVFHGSKNRKWFAAQSSPNCLAP
jgi:hypothetical protein